MHFFRFTNRLLQLTSASEQLLELLMQLLLLKQFSAAGVFSTASGMGAWGLCTGGGVPRAQNLGLTPCQRRAENGGLRQFLKQQQLHYSSSSCSEALVSCRKRFVNRKKCIRH